MAESIVSSISATDNHAQKDGTRWVWEIHTDSAGREHRFDYLATPAMMSNLKEVMDARAIALAAQLIDEEAASKAEAVVVVAKNKLDEYLQKLPPEELKEEGGFTDEELEAILKRENLDRPSVERGK